MRRNIGLYGLLVVACVFVLTPCIPFLLSGCERKQMAEQVEPQPIVEAESVGVGSFQLPTNKPRHEFYKSRERDDLGGVSRSDYFTINWGPEKTHPVDVLSSTLLRMEHIQQTMAASDTNARALWHVMQARDILAGMEIDQNPGGLGATEETESETK